MHTMQYLATELQLDLEEEYTDEELRALAQEEVGIWLDNNANENGYLEWSDWYAVGGRWSHIPVEIYNDDNACSFLSKLEDIEKRQLDQFNEYFGEFDFPTINTLMTKYSSGQTVDYREIYEANVNSLEGALKIMRGYWTWDSGFLDTTGGSPKTDYLREKLGIDKTQYRSVYCLVPVDFHF